MVSKEASDHSIALVALLRGMDIDRASDWIDDLRKDFGDNLVSDVIGMAADTEEAGLLAYSLVSHMLSEKTEALWHRIARDMLSNELCHYSHAYESSLVHAKEIRKLEPNNVRNLELMIDIGTSRTKLLSENEIKDIAAQIRSLDPNSKWGQRYGRD